MSSTVGAEIIFLEQFKIFCLHQLILSLAVGDSTQDASNFPLEDFNAFISSISMNS